jgi:hypothetical protein
MKLFARLSTAEAAAADRGALRGDFVWFDNPQPDEAADDSVWVAIDLPENRMSRFERRIPPGLGHREFLLPARITNLHRPERLQPPLS